MLTYETILSAIRHHLSDEIIGKGKFSREERLADHLAGLSKIDAEKQGIVMKNLEFRAGVSKDPYPRENDEKLSSGLIGSTSASTQGHKQAFSTGDRKSVV